MCVPDGEHYLLMTTTFQSMTLTDCATYTSENQLHVYIHVVEILGEATF